MPNKYKIAVLMGGSSFERDFSLASGKHVIKTLEAEGHSVLALDTSSELVNVLRAEKPDICLIALHGGHGEDGTVQSLLEYLQIPFIGSPACVCRSTWNKSMLPYVVLQHRSGNAGPSSWPKSVCLSAAAFKEMGAANALDLLETNIDSGYPMAVLPASGGSAMGINRVESFDEVANALLDALSYDDEVLIEEWVEGVELAVTVIGTAEQARILQPVEICPKTGYFKTEARLQPELVDYYCPARQGSFSDNIDEAKRIMDKIEAAALEVHRAFGCRDLSRVDLYWTGNEVKVLEINISPGMAEFSLLPMACRASGMSFGELLNEMIETTLRRQR